MIQPNLLRAASLSLLIWIFAGCQTVQPVAEETTEPEVAESETPVTDQKSAARWYNLNLSIDPENQSISGYTEILIEAGDHQLKKTDLDLHDNFVVSEVSVDGQSLEFSHETGRLTVKFDDPLRRHERVKVRVYYEGKPVVSPNPPWSGGFVWEEDDSGNHLIGVTTQTAGGQIWFPAMDHPALRPDSAAINITVPKPYFVASNGLLRDITESGEYQTFHWSTKYPIHTYNITMNVGMYEEVEKTYITENGTEMPVVFYVLPESREYADQILDMTILKLKQLRNYFGEYGFTDEKFGLVETSYLGMEHQTINAYGNQFRFDTVAGREYDWLLLHELIHEWWGNLITVTDWADFWIHEGITTYGDALFLDDFAGAEYYHAKLAEYSCQISNRSPVAPMTASGVDDVYNHDIYYKGAWFMHSLRHFTGPDLFAETLREFALANRYQATSSEKFRIFWKQYSGTDPLELMNIYLYSTTIPQTEIRNSGNNSWEISIPNIETELPVDVMLSGETIRLNLGSNPVRVNSESEPVIDPENWYLKNDICFEIN